MTPAQIILLLAAPLFAAAPARPRSVILVLADGMSWGQIQLARDAARLDGKTLAMERVMKEGHAAYCGMTPRNSLVVESGAGAGAYATGRKIENRTLSQLPDGLRVETILELAHRRGLGSGLVTTARLTHATPSAFLVHRALRDDEFAIARDIADSDFDVLVGGGAGRFPPSVLATARAKGYVIERDAAELARRGLADGKTLALLAEETFPYEIDRSSSVTTPRLETMARWALERLTRGGKGFVLVIDARLIDEVSHYHDAGAVLSEVLVADRAIAVALEYLAAHPDTELVVASNHDTAGMGMSWRINPPGFGGASELRLITGQRASYRAMLETLWRRGGLNPSPALTLEVLRAGLAPGITLTEDDGRAIAAAFTVGPKALPFAHSPATHAIARALEKQTLVLWGTGTHMSAPQPCFGIGPGSERLHGLIENTDVFQALRPAADYQ